MIQLSDLVSRVRTKYEQATGVRWTTDQIEAILGEGLDSLAEATYFYERYASVPISPNRQWYDLRGFTPETVVRIKSIHNSNRNLWLKPTSTEELPYNFEQSVGEPQCFFTRGIYWFGLWPRAGDGHTGTLRVYFAGIPSEFSIPQAVIRDLPDNHIIALEDYALYEMSAQDRESKRAVAYYQSYKKREKSLKDFIDDRLTHGYPGRMSSMRR